MTRKYMVISSVEHGDAAQQNYCGHQSCLASTHFKIGRHTTAPA